MYKAIIFDLDDTLVQRDTAILLPGREKALTRLKNQGVKMYIASNQSPPTWRLIHSRKKQRESARRYYTLGDMISRFESVMNQLPIIKCYAAMIVGDEPEATELRNDLKLPDRIIDLSPAKIIMSYRLDWRKPLPGMLYHILSANKLNRRECLFVGDNERDRRAAAAAWMDFSHANCFFDS